ncbi:MAG TPA: cupin domain-containing protein [Solirubrobacteraceae bacterium]|nr:cupin domain-containing protein [Solirubrobacteraceae bacterium]
MNGETISDRAARNVVLLHGHPDLTVTWSRYGPGELGPDLHVHHEHTDAFYVLDGELTFDVGPEPRTIRVAAGGFVAVPPDVGHGFRNESEADVRWLNFHAPDKGFAEYMRGARDGVSVDFDSFDVPDGGGLPADLVTVNASGGADLPELRVRPDGAQVVVEAGGQVLRLDA